MKPRQRSIASALLVTLLGTGVLWQGTDGFRAFTAEGARRVDILRAPRALPAVVLEDQDGRAFRLQDYQNQLLAVDFIYTRCMTICRNMSRAFKQIRDRVPQQMLGRDFSLLSISIDMDRDDVASLNAYASIYGADSTNWRIARVSSKADLKSLLEAFGIVVIPDGLGGFEHNAAIHLLGRAGKLVQISDIDQPIAFADGISAWL